MTYFIANAYCNAEGDRERVNVLNYAIDNVSAFKMFLQKKLFNMYIVKDKKALDAKLPTGNVLKIKLLISLRCFRSERRFNKVLNFEIDK